MLRHYAPTALAVSAISLLTAVTSSVFAQGVPILEPIGNYTQINTANPGEIFNYLYAVFPWVYGVCAGLVVVWGLVSGFLMVAAGGDQAKFTSAKGHLIAAIAGLLLLIFARTILHTINPTFFL